MGGAQHRLGKSKRLTGVHCRQASKAASHVLPGALVSPCPGASHAMRAEQAPYDQWTNLPLHPGWRLLK